MFGKLFGKDFDGNFTPELAVEGAVDFSHPTRTNGGEDLISTQLSVGSQWHGRPFERENSPLRMEKSRTFLALRWGQLAGRLAGYLLVY